MKQLFPLLLSLAACGTSAQSTGIEPLTCDPSTSPTYADFGAAFMTDHCMSCHASKDSPRLSTQAMVKQNADRMLEAAVYTDAMPQDEDISLEERRMLGEWLACGAP